MGLQYAVFFACVVASMVWPTTEKWAPSFHWTKKMTIKNPENSPPFNYAELGPLQDAWQVLEETSINTYFLMFRSHVSVYQTCVYATANIADKTKKTANYTVTFYHPFKEKYQNNTVQVKALSQTDYPLENVIRANLKGTLPSATPVPPGSYTYAEYDNSTGYSRSTPFPDRGVAANLQPSTPDSNDLTKDVLDRLFRDPENPQYMDMYVVYNEPQCYIIRSPAAWGGCDLWLRKTELKSIVDDLKEDIIKKEKELTEKYKKKLKIYENCTATDKQKGDLQFKVDYYIVRWFQDVVWKRISFDCVLAYMITCGAPVFSVYNPVACNTSLTNQYLSIS
uniref:Putative salivary lipocalin n=1 Tax=Ixodes ricinus TaxID=34613 RepID=A0A0K8RE30_IXORI